MEILQKIFVPLSNDLWSHRYIKIIYMESVRYGKTQRNKKQYG